MAPEARKYPGIVWGQMEEHEARGVVYVRDEHSPDELIFSKTYQCLDGKVTRTAVPIFEALDEAERRNSPQFAVVSALLKWLPSRSGRPVAGQSVIAGEYPWFWSMTQVSVLFITKIGHGASGEVWRSSDGSQVIKVYVDRELAEHEARVLVYRARAKTLPGS
ncbi:hypothetical protein B0H14DRAFT_2603301 [Mycena olivaceomarginata]|nr:hypothetical protein B0H14DRAFT_2603301 [Mycena olivaceomarginata]